MTPIGKILLALIIVACIVFSPFILVWAINALGFAVAYTFKTWFAALLIILIIGRGT